MMSVRAVVKSAIEHGAVWSGSAARARAHRRDEILVLAYHNIVPTGEPVTGDRSLHLPQAAFADQLDRLLDTHDIVPLDTAFPRDDTMRARTPSSRPRAVITFDDAYRGGVVAGVEELQKRSLPATIFVAPDFVGGRDFWWDVLTPADAPGLAPAVRDHALLACRGRDAEVRQWAAEQNIPTTDVPPHMTCASESELHSALSMPKLTLGSHTWSHPNLTQLGAAELRHELGAPLVWLTERFHHRVVSAISYPYGCMNAAVLAATHDATYQHGFLITGGFTSAAPSDTTAIPRLNVPAGVSPYGFVIRTAGFMNG